MVLHCNKVKSIPGTRKSAEAKNCSDIRQVPTSTTSTHINLDHPIIKPCVTHTNIGDTWNEWNKSDIHLKYAKPCLSTHFLIL